MEIQDETKVTHHYLESINGKYSLASISGEEQQLGMGMEASNNKQAIEEYNKLDSKAKRLKAVKEQISIGKKGFGWDNAGHKWSENSCVYSSRELLEHFLNVVLPIKQSGDQPIPTEPPVIFLL